MYKIGDFSSMSKTTIKPLRYYEKEFMSVFSGASASKVETIQIL